MKKLFTRRKQKAETTTTTVVPTFKDTRFSESFTCHEHRRDGGFVPEYALTEPERVEINFVLRQLLPFELVHVILSTAFRLVPVRLAVASDEPHLIEDQERRREAKRREAERESGVESAVPAMRVGEEGDERGDPRCGGTAILGTIAGVGTMKFSCDFWGAACPGCAALRGSTSEATTNPTAGDDPFCTQSATS